MKESERNLTSIQWLSGLYRRLALLQVVSYVSNCVCMIVDSAVTGVYLGAQAMASFGLAAPLCTLCFALALTCGGGTNILCINASAGGDRNRVRNRFVLSVIGSGVISLALAMLLFFFSPQIIHAISGGGAEDSILADAAGYLKYYAPGLPAVVLNMIFMSVFPMDGEKTLLVVATAVLSTADIVLDLMVALVFKTGLPGMAVATVASQYAELFVLLIHFGKHGKLFKLRLKKPEWKTMFDFIPKGIPMGLQLALMAAMTVIANSILLTRFGTDAVSVMAAVFSTGALLRVTGDAAGCAVIPIAALCDGEKNRELLKAGFSYGCKWNYVVCGCLSVVEFLLAGPIAKLYFDDPALIAIATQAFRFFALSIGLYGGCYLVQSAYQAIGDNERAMFCSLLADFAVPVLCILVQSRLFGLTGFWLTFITGKAVTLLLYWSYGKKHREKADAPGFGELFVVPEEKYRTEEKLDCEVAQTGDVTEISERIRKTMLDRGESKRTAGALALAVEEITAFILRYGVAGKQKIYVNIFMTFDGGVWTVRIRDNGPGENPLNCLVTDETVDEFSKIGIKMAGKMVKDLKYIRTAETNNIIMKVQEEKTA